jgi:alkylated DNA nucleotide flippase Atl1
VLPPFEPHMCDGARLAGMCDGARLAGMCDGARLAGMCDGARLAGMCDGARLAGPTCAMVHAWQALCFLRGGVGQGGVGMGWE